MSMQDGGHVAAAVAALGTREYGTAGDEYTRAARRVLSDPRPDLGPFEADEKGAVEGVSVARDLTNALEGPAQQACLEEFVADFQVAGDLDGVEAAYESAADAYRDAAVDDPQSRATTPLFRAAIAPLKQVARGPANGEIAVAWEDVHGDDPASPGAFLARRPAYKRQRFPGLVQRAVDDGYLAAPRGTTEYDNANHACPNCGSSDVNWVGNQVLCLRCSTPAEEV
ncbi:hypothetical protein BRD14_00210 [Halobacteriales archaeon SW_5_68_122]|nr:MAG: hypothetical protein BRD14_00210 [Halobacteriales archaeon SW_5_68_122]